MNQDAHPTLEEVAAQMRAEYANFTPEQRERLGDEPDDILIHCRWNRIHCSRHTEEERDANIARAMSIVYGAAEPHASHATRC